MALETNYFHLLGLPVQFEVDLAALDNAWKKVQRQVHPDRFVRSSEQEKRQAVQWASQVNEAYRVLKNPLQRAMYLCELHKLVLNLETHTQMRPEFLMQQMEWRESLEEAQQSNQINGLVDLQQQVTTLLDSIVQSVQEAFAKEPVPESILESIREWTFLEKFLQEIKNSFETLPQDGNQGSIKG